MEDNGYGDKEEEEEENVKESISFIRKNDNNNKKVIKWSDFSAEVEKLGRIAGPMVAVVLSQYLLQVISMMMVGHLDELSLSSTAIAISLSTVTGFSLLMGMASALETLCGQAYGAQQYHKLGLQTETAIFCLVLVCIPLSLIWIYMGEILVFIGQDPIISHEAVFKSGLQKIGGALAMCISYWLNVIFLLLYIKYSSACAKTRTPISMDLFHGIAEFFSFAIPSAVMICLEWWSYELLVLLSGLLPNPELETSVLSICLTTISTLYSIPYGFGAAASTRVSNELGAGNPQAARLAVYAVLFLAIVEASIVASVLFGTRRVFGYVFSNEKAVVDYVTVMAPLICVSSILDSLQGVLSGVVRGCGFQHIGAYVNLGAFYLCGIPVAALLGFWVKLRGIGLWIGVQVGAFTQTLLLALVTSSTNWEKQATKARQRIFEIEMV
ncbi:protein DETOXIFICATION 12-like isoform X3 [Euphorbia lathyris]|uniref:protein DETOXIFICATION 12-like isoform X3 n=1 Tax=Euphorbia lathyris TaxID=212925 RepID=UPI0033140E4B